ncbi:SGNH/GDSL hydrolase family protein, partial [Pseudomonas aeruginosa]
RASPATAAAARARRAALLDGQLRELATALGAGYCAVGLEMQPQYLAIDGYHPSALGYQVWGEHLAQWLVAAERG